MQVRDSVCLVTGGSAGLGLATAQHLLERGAKVASLDVRPPAPGVAEAGGFHQQVDITDDNAVRDAVAAVAARFGTIHACINCAGILHSAPLLDDNGIFPVALFRRTVDVNLTGSFIVMARAAEVMARNPGAGPDGERGVVVNTASIAGLDASSNLAYGASKGGVVAMTLTAARQLGPYRIRVNAIAPGFMDTDMFVNLPPEYVERCVAQTVFPKRLGTAGEFGAMVASVMENGFLNGTVLRFDAGSRV